MTICCISKKIHAEVNTIKCADFYKFQNTEIAQVCSQFFKRGCNVFNKQDIFSQNKVVTKTEYCFENFVILL